MGGNFDWYGIGQGVRRAAEEYVAGQQEREERERQRKQLRLRAIDEQLSILRETAQRPDDPELQRLLQEREQLLRDLLQEPSFRLPRVPGAPSSMAAPRPSAQPQPTKTIAGPRPSAPAAPQPRSTPELIQPGALPAVERERERRERVAQLGGQLARAVASAGSEAELQAAERQHAALRAIHPDLPDISPLVAQRRAELRRQQEESGSEAYRQLWARAMSARSPEEFRTALADAARLRQQYPNLIPADFEAQAQRAWERQQVPTAIAQGQVWLERIANSQGPARDAAVRAAVAWRTQLVEQYPFLAQVLPDPAAFARDATRWERDTADRQSWQQQFQALHKEYRQALTRPQLGTLSMLVGELNSLIRYGRARGWTNVPELDWNQVLSTWHQNVADQILNSRLDRQAKELQLQKLRVELQLAQRRLAQGADSTGGALVYANDQFAVVRQGNRQRIFDKRTGVEYSMADLREMARRGNRAAQELVGFGAGGQDDTYQKLSTEQLLALYNANVPEPDEKDPRKVQLANERRAAIYRELLRRRAAPAPTPVAAEIMRRWQSTHEPVPADKFRLLSPEEQEWLRVMGVQVGGTRGPQPAREHPRIEQTLELLAGAQRAGPLGSQQREARAAWERLSPADRRRLREIARARGIQLPAWAQ